MFDAAHGLTYEGRGRPNPRHSPVRYTEENEGDPASGYIASAALVDAVNAALFLRQPLLVTGEPGTGKTMLAHSIAWEFDLPLHTFHTKMNSSGSDLFYRYDALLEFRDSHSSRSTTDGGWDQRRYVSYAALGTSILYSHSAGDVARYLRPDAKHPGVPTRSVVLIDEIDKAPRDFPNDILHETERLSFYVKETGWTIPANRQYWPILVCTSNLERSLPDAFLRRCVFFHIDFPNEDQLWEIVHQRLDARGTDTPQMWRNGIRLFNQIRQNERLVKKPATAEMLQWLRLLGERGVSSTQMEDRSFEILPTMSVLLKTREDLDLARTMFPVR
jgi:MoxR-like ATPase